MDELKTRSWLKKGTFDDITTIWRFLAPEGKKYNPQKRGEKVQENKDQRSEAVELEEATLRRSKRTKVTAQGPENN